jgi:hypothetical protein
VYVYCARRRQPVRHTWYRQADGHAQPTQGLRGIEDDVAALRVHHLAHDHQSQPAAFHAAGEFVMEALERAFERHRGDAGRSPRRRAGVRLVGAQRDLDSPSRRVAHGVVY